MRTGLTLGDGGTTAHGVHWWTIGMGPARRGDATPDAFMWLAFIAISALRNHGVLSPLDRRAGRPA
jgi:hypothetical protein